MNSENVLISAIFDRKLRILWHILFWVFLYLDEFLSLVGITPELESPQDFFINLFANALIVYFNIYILRPFLLNKKQYVLYAISSIACILLIVYVDELIYAYDVEAEFIVSHWVSNFAFNAFLLAVPIGIKTVKESWSKQMREEQIAAEKLNLELAYLKNQINPHILFNTLNSLYIQSKKKDGDVSESLLSFSELLRYQLYDCQNEYVNLDKEIEYIENYLELEKSRRDYLDIKIYKQIEKAHLKIAPLLFLLLIENASKYSMTSGIDKAYIYINIIQNSEQLVFNIKNNIGFKSNEDNPHSGIGLSNLRRRLELYYPSKHELFTEGQEKNYQVKLILNL